MEEQRSAKSLRRLTLVIFIYNIISVLIHVLPTKGRLVLYLKNIDFFQSTNFSGIVLVMLIPFILLSMPKNINGELNEEAKEKTFPLKCLNLILGILMIAICILTKDKFIIKSLAIAELALILTIILTRNYVLYGLDPTQRKWQEATKGHAIDSGDSSVFWRFKFWFNGIVNVPFKERSINLVDLILIFVCTNAVISYDLNIASIILFVIAIKSICTIIEYFLGLYTTLTGYCTGIMQHSSRNNTPYWYVYITDFKHKREIKYTTHVSPYLNDGDEVIVVHGIFSKKVLKVNDIKIK